MNAWKTTYHNVILEDLTYIIPTRDTISVHRAFAGEFEKSLIELKDDAKIIPMYPQDINSACIATIKYIDDATRELRIMNLNLYNWDGIIIWNSVDKTLEFNNIIKEYVGNVLFDYKIHVDHLRRIEFSKTFDSSNKKLNNRRKEYLKDLL